METEDMKSWATEGVRVSLGYGRGPGQPRLWWSNLAASRELWTQPR